MKNVKKPKEGLLEDVVPEEVSAVETPAVPESLFVVLNKSGEPEPDTQSATSGATPVEAYPLTPDPQPVETTTTTTSGTTASLADTTTEVTAVVVESSEVIQKALADIEQAMASEAMTDVQKAKLLDLALSLEETPVEKGDGYVCKAEGCTSKVAKEGDLCKSCGEKMNKEGCNPIEEMMGKVAKAFEGVCERLEKLGQPAEPVAKELSEDVILAKAEEIKKSREAASMSESEKEFNARVQSLADTVTRLEKMIVREALGQDA